MARARLLSNKISRSERVNDLSIPARLLYTWLIPHLDCEGRFSGNPAVVKQTVIPLTNFSYATVDRWLDQMQAAKDPETTWGLIERYEVQGKQYLWMPGFNGEQSSRGGQAWKQREIASEIPAPPGFPVAPAEKPKKPAKDSASDILDPVFKQMVIDYESNIGMLTPILMDKLIAIQDHYPEGWFTEAVKEAVTYGKRNIRYIERILERWQQEEFKSGNGKTKTATEKPASIYSLD